MISAAVENNLTLARLLDISEDEAARALDASFALTFEDGDAGLAAEIIHQMERTIRLAASETQQVDLEIVIGTAQPKNRSLKKIFVSLTPSYVSISCRSKGGVDPNLPGLLIVVASSYIASVALAKVLHLDDLASKRDPFIVRFGDLGIVLSMLDREIHVGDTALIGAGAVGNGFLRAARHLNISGVLDVVDPKNISKGNANRCLYFAESDEGLPKAATLCQRAQPQFPNLQLVPQNMAFGQLRASKKRIKTVIVGTDSRRVRRSIQAELPLEVVDGSTTGTDEIIIHSHQQPTGHACLACIYKHTRDEDSREKEIAAGLGIQVSDVKAGFINTNVAERIAANHHYLVPSDLVGKSFDSLFKQLCATKSLLTPKGEQVLAPFAFVSCLAGALLALELVRLRSIPHLETRKNYFFLSPWHPPVAAARRLRPRDPECEFCSKTEARQVLAYVWPEYLT